MSDYRDFEPEDVVGPLDDRMPEPGRQPQPGGPLPRSPMPSGPNRGAGFRGVLIGFLLPVIIVGAVLITPFINGDTYPPDPILDPFVDASCWAQIRFPDIIRDFYTPIVCDYYEFDAGSIRPPGPAICGESCRTDSDCAAGLSCLTEDLVGRTMLPCRSGYDCVCANAAICVTPSMEACGLACDLDIGATCPEGFDCISGTCQNNEICMNACGQTCVTDADCPGGLSCIEDRGLYGADPPTGVFMCFNTDVCSHVGGVEACGMACDPAVGADCPTGFECESGACWGGAACICGNGVCDATETGISCPADCYVASCDLTLSCGDFICNTDCETGENCAVDCGCFDDGVCNGFESLFGTCADCASDTPEEAASPFCGSACSSNEDCAGLGVNPVCAGGQCYDAQECGGPPASGGTGSGDDEGGGKPAECGNGVVESGEACDGNNNGSCNWQTEYCTNSCSCDSLD